jgi:7-keto-8-aminopelargonate synthetase-like enzyme
MSGHPTALAQAFKAARLGGRVNLLGLPKGEVPLNLSNDVIFRGITVYGVIGRRMYETWHQMRTFLSSGHLDPTPVITHRFPLERSMRRSKRSPPALRGKIILEIGLNPMSSALDQRLHAELDQFRADSVSRLNHLDSPQAAVTMEGRGEVIILSSNNYLGLSNHPAVVAAGHAALDRFGAGTASVRFICGTFTVHRDLEAALAECVGSQAALSFVSCWNANEALFATLLGPEDVIISDQLNHASIIDGIRLARVIAKCETTVYRHADLADLEAKLEAHRDRRTRLIVTDGVFSMEGDIAPLPDIVALARRHDAIVAVDDSHATGVLGASGRGTAEHYDMVGSVDIVTSTLGKALGGAAGGFIAASAATCDSSCSARDSSSRTSPCRGGQRPRRGP